MAHVQKPDLIFQRNGRVHLNRQGHQFSRLLAAEACASAVVMLDAPCSKVVWRVLATHSICQFPLHFLSRASPCAITFQLDSTNMSIFFITKVMLTSSSQPTTCLVTLPQKLVPNNRLKMNIMPLRQFNTTSHNTKHDGHAKVHILTEYSCEHCFSLTFRHHASYI
jgi:hypothetical protein